MKRLFCQTTHGQRTGLSEFFHLSEEEGQNLIARLLVSGSRHSAGYSLLHIRVEGGYGFQDLWRAQKCTVLFPTHFQNMACERGQAAGQDHIEAAEQGPSALGNIGAATVRHDGSENHTVIDDL